MAVSGSSSGSDGGAARRLVELGDWVGLPGAEAAEAARSSGFRPAMELVESDEPSGEVVEQHPEAGTLAARGSSVALFISTSAELDEEVAAPPEDWEGEMDDVLKAVEVADREVGARELEPGEEASEGEWVRCPRDTVSGVVPPRGDAGAFDSGLNSREEAAPATRRDPVGHEGAMPRLVRVQWLLVVGGWRVLWGEALLAAVLALAVAWGVGGIAGLAGALALVAVLAGLCAAACLAAGGTDGGETGRRACGERPMVVDLEQRRRWPDGRFD